MRPNAGWFKRLATMRGIAAEHGQPALFYGMMAKRLRDAVRGRSRAWKRLPTSERRFLHHDKTVPLDTVITMD